MVIALGLLALRMMLFFVCLCSIGDFDSYLVISHKITRLFFLKSLNLFLSTNLCLTTESVIMKRPLKDTLKQIGHDFNPCGVLLYGLKFSTKSVDQFILFLISTIDIKYYKTLSNSPSANF